MSAGKTKKYKQSNKMPEQQASISSKYLILSFIFPFVISGTVFALHKVFPFGDRQVLINDFFTQYYPFLSNLWYKLRDGTVSTWSWTAGLGHDYVALIAYYMASPLNLLALIFPHAWLRETLTLVLLVKIGLAGMFTAIFLRYIFRYTGISQVVFSSLYALCAYTMSFYWTIIWFDGFALLPLVMMGLLKLFKDGKYRLYIVSLALTLFINFYMGFFVCIFIVIAFFSLCIIKRLKVCEFLSKLTLIVAYSGLAIGMAATLLIPTLSALGNKYNISSIFPEPALFFSFFEILGNFIAFTQPTITYGLPNLYCGLLTLMLTGFYFVSVKIPLREKLTLGGIVVLLLVCCNFSVLYHIMHGFRNTNAIPFRFSFLISFTLVIMAYRAFLLTESITRRELLAMCASAVLFLLSASIGCMEKNAVIGSIIFCAFYLVMFCFFAALKKDKKRIVIKTIILLIVLTELSINSWNVIRQVKLTSRNNYPEYYEEMQTLLAMCQPAGNNFYRTVRDRLYCINDPFLYNYNGISFFSSTASDIILFFNGLGLSAGENGFIYNETSPLTNFFLNIRYMIGSQGNLVDKGNWNIIGREGRLLLLENKYYLPLGFMVNEEMAEYKNNNNPFLLQNDLFSRATGLTSSLFTVMNISALAESDNKGGIVWNFTMPSDALLYVYCMTDSNPNMDISVNGKLIISGIDSYIFPVNYFSKDDVITFSHKSRDIKIYLGIMDHALFEQGYALLADEPLNLTHFSETKVRGTVTALQDGILYTSIPGRNWQVYVDGVKSELLLIDNAMAAVRLGKGTHEVEFRYLNKSFIAGCVVSIVSLIVFILLVCVRRRK